MCRLTGQKLIVETPAVYASPGMQAYIQQELHRPCKRWVVDVLNGSREASEVRLRTSEFVLLPDTERVNRYGPVRLSPPCRNRGSQWDCPDGPAPVHEGGEFRRFLGNGRKASAGAQKTDVHPLAQYSPRRLRMHPSWHWRSAEGAPPGPLFTQQAQAPAADGGAPAQSCEQVNWLAIATEPGLRSLRDLRGRHLPMLRRMLRMCKRRIHAETGVPPEEIMAYVHYPPSVYQLHVHFAFPYAQYNHRDVFRIHSLANVINNLQIDPDYYRKARLQVSLGRNSTLHQICAGGDDTPDDTPRPARRNSI